MSKEKDQLTTPLVSDEMIREFIPELKHIVSSVSQLREIVKPILNIAYQRLLAENEELRKKVKDVLSNYDHLNELNADKYIKIKDLQQQLSEAKERETLVATIFAEWKDGNVVNYKGGIYIVKVDIGIVNEYNSLTELFHSPEFLQHLESKLMEVGK